MVDRPLFKPDPYDPNTQHLYSWHYDQQFERWTSSPKSIKPQTPSVETRITPEGLQVRPVGERNWINYSHIPSSIKK